MICVQVSEQTESEMYKHYVQSLKIKHSPPFYVEMAEAYIKSYEFKHGSDLPVIDDIPKHYLWILIMLVGL